MSGETVKSFSTKSVGLAARPRSHSKAATPVVRWWAGALRSPTMMPACKCACVVCVAVLLAGFPCNRFNMATECESITKPKVFLPVRPNTANRFHVLRNQS